MDLRGPVKLRPFSPSPAGYMVLNTGNKFLKWVTLCRFEELVQFTTLQQAQCIRWPWNRCGSRANQTVCWDADAICQGFQTYHPWWSRHDDAGCASCSPPRHWAVYEECSLLHYLQLCQQDHSCDPESLHAIQIFSLADRWGWKASWYCGGSREVSKTATSLTLVFSYSPNYPRVNLSDDGKKALLKLSKGDMRRALNILQACHAAYDLTGETEIYNCTGNPHPSDIETIVNSMLADEFTISYQSMISITILTDIRLTLDRSDIYIEDWKRSCSSGPYRGCLWLCWDDRNETTCSSLPARLPGYNRVCHFIAK